MSVLSENPLSRSSGVSVVRASDDTAPGVGLAERFTLWFESNKAVRRTRQVFPFLASALGLWLCLRFCSGIDWRTFAHDVGRARAGIALLLLAPIVGNFVHMLGWRGLLPAAARPGRGRSLAVFLAAQGWDVTGFDPSEEGVRIARSNAEKASVKIRAVVARDDEFDYGSNQWDLIVVTYVRDLDSNDAKRLWPRLVRLLRQANIYPE